MFDLKENEFKPISWDWKLQQPDSFNQNFAITEPTFLGGANWDNAEQP